MQRNLTVRKALYNLPMNQVAAQTNAHDAHACRVAQVVEQVEGVEQVILFGSRARGDFRPESDLDLVVVYETTKTRSDVFLPCVQAARDATVDEYGHSVSVDITPLAADHFDFMQHGINHVAAHAAREGITPMGEFYRPPSEPGEPNLPEHRRRESMERAWHARSHLTTLMNVYRLGVDSYEDSLEWDKAIGEQAQRALEHALKAVIAAHGRRYPHEHKFEDLLGSARTCVAGLTLQSDLEVLSAFGGGTAYETPELDLDVDQLLENVRHDVTHLFAICAGKADFDPWKVTGPAFKRGE